MSGHRRSRLVRAKRTSQAIRNRHRNRPHKECKPDRHHFRPIEEGDRVEREEEQSAQHKFRPRTKSTRRRRILPPQMSRTILEKWNGRGPVAERRAGSRELACKVAPNTGNRSERYSAADPKNHACGGHCEHVRQPRAGSRRTMPWHGLSSQPSGPARTIRQSSGKLRDKTTRVRTDQRT